MYVKPNRGWLALCFKYNGQRCTEFLGLPDNRDNQREAKKLGEQIEAEIRAGTFDYARRFPNSKRLARLGLVSRPDRTLGEFALDWLKELETDLTPGIYYNYGLQLKNHLLDSALAKMRLPEITDTDVNALKTSLVAKFKDSPKAGTRTINMVIARLRTIFVAAKYRKLVADDPMKRVKNLRQPKPEVDPFDLDEGRALIGAAQGWERCFIIVLICTGMRPNEALALRWSQIDWRHGLIRIRESVGRDGELALTKTTASERDIEMIETVRAALQEQRARSELKGNFVFPSEAGTTIDLNNFRARNWPRLLKRANVSARTIYQCRHTFACLALEHGDTPQHIADQLGHGTVRMLFDVYGRWCRRPKSAALEALDRAISITAVSPIFGGESPVTQGKGR